MKIRILYFAAFRDAVGKDEETRELPTGATVETLWKTLQGDVPFFGAWPRIPPVAVNCDYAEACRALGDDDEVAFLPPVAGG